MSSSPPCTKRPRLDGEITLEDLPDHVLDKILRFLPMKDRIHSRIVNKLWRRLMCYTDGRGCLYVTKLPFKADLLAATKCVTAAGITAALQCLLQQPQMGSRLKSLSFASVDRRWKMAASHFDLIVQYCPGLTSLVLVNMCCGEPNDCNWEALRRLTHLTVVTIADFSNPSKIPEYFEVTQKIASLIVTWSALDQLNLAFFEYLPLIAAPKLKVLKLKNCKHLDDFQLAQICQTSPNLTDLALIGSVGGLEDFTPFAQWRHLAKIALANVTLGDDVMESIALSCPALNHLELENADVGKFTWLHHLGHLEFFSVSPGLIDSDVANLPDNWSVERLRLLESRMTNAGLYQLAGKCPQLRTLELHNDTITDAGINGIAAMWNGLVKLKLLSRKITIDSLVTLAQRNNLGRLDITGCSGISSAHGFWLLAAKRRGKVGRPLRIKLDRNHVVFAIEKIAQLREQLNKVGVTLMH